MFVPEYHYDDPLTGEPYHRVKFSLEGDRAGRKATVWAEVSSATGDFRYLIVGTRDGGKVISIVDRRPPLMTREERQARVSSLLQDAGWAFFADNEVDVREQGGALGDYWLKCKVVTEAERVAEKGGVGVGGGGGVSRRGAQNKGCGASRQQRAARTGQCHRCGWRQSSRARRGPPPGCRTPCA